MLSRQLNVLNWMWIWFSGRLIKQYTCTRTRKHTYIFRSDTNKSLYSFYTFRAELYVKTLLCPLLPFSITIKYFLKELKCFFYFTLKSKRYNCTNCKKKPTPITLLLLLTLTSRAEICIMACSDRNMIIQTSQVITYTSDCFNQEG